MWSNLLILQSTILGMLDAARTVTSSWTAQRAVHVETGCGCTRAYDELYDIMDGRLSGSSRVLVYFYLYYIFFLRHVISKTKYKPSVRLPQPLPTLFFFLALLSPRFPHGNIMQILVASAVVLSAVVLPSLAQGPSFMVNSP